MDSRALRPAHPAPASRSPRGRLARLAGGVAASTTGVVRLAAGDPLARTWDGDGWVEGVGCIAEPNGRYELRLHLVVALVSFDRLARTVRERIVARATEQGLSKLIGPTRIVIEEVESTPLSHDSEAHER